MVHPPGRPRSGRNKRVYGAVVPPSPRQSGTDGVDHLQHMQKALDQMNLQLRHVSDRGGHFWRVSATRIRWLHSAIGGSRPSAYN
jgi:hypothetical protein